MAGFPSLPPSPHGHRPVHPDDSPSKWSRCAREIAAILDETSVDYSSVSMCHVNNEKAAKSISTIVVTVESSRDSAWSQALVTISLMLHSEGLSHLGVLLLGPDAEKGPRSFEFSYQHHVVTIWPKLSHRVADVLEDMGLSFLDLNIYNWGNTKSAARMTVVLTLDLDDVLRTDEMKILRRRIKDIYI